MLLGRAGGGGGQSNISIGGRMTPHGVRVDSQGSHSSRVWSSQTSPPPLRKTVVLPFDFEPAPPFAPVTGLLALAASGV